VREIAALIDHTLLKAQATGADIRRLCQEARQYGFATVCVNPYWVALATSELAASAVRVASVVGFPLGANTAVIKVAETEDAMAAGAREIDMVLNIGELCAGNLTAVAGGIAAVVAVAHARGAVVKVILETALLSDDQKIAGCTLSQQGGADFVKTSTGFSTHGATVQDVALMRRIVGPNMGVKASGGIRTLEDLQAMRAGKDVYSEKPLTLTIDEGKHLVEAVRSSKRVLQVGSQQRSDPKFRLACEVVRNGRIGKLREVTVILPQGARGGPFESRPAPQGLDWDMWQGQAPKTDYVEQRCHNTFRYWWEYSGGTMTDWGAHHNDIALWGMGMDHSGPVTVSGKPAVEMVPGGYTAFSEYHIEYTYANGVKHHCISTMDDTGFGAVVRRGAGTYHNGVRFDGTNGWVWVTRGELLASKREILEEPLPADAERLYASNNHKGNFFECIRTRKDPVAPVEVGHRSISVCHLGVMSMRMGRSLNWDPEKQQFVNDAEADKWLSREQRKPYSYESILA